MPIVLYRVDERLIHGQVTVGWGSTLEPDRIIVVDDELADAPWEQDLYRLGVPDRVEVEFLGVEDARDALGGWREDELRSILLARDVRTMRRLAEGGALEGERVNIGGIHHAAGRQAVLPYVYLGAEEREELRALEDAGVEVSAQDLPGSRRVSLDELVEVE